MHKIHHTQSGRYTDAMTLLGGGPLLTRAEVARQDLLERFRTTALRGGMTVIALAALLSAGFTIKDLPTDKDAPAQEQVVKKACTKNSCSFRP